jgi:hypothetical protein
LTAPYISLSQVIFAFIAIPSVSFWDGMRWDKGYIFYINYELRKLPLTWTNFCIYVQASSTCFRLRWLYTNNLFLSISDWLCASGHVF